MIRTNITFQFRNIKKVISLKHVSTNPVESGDRAKPPIPIFPDQRPFIKPKLDIDISKPSTFEDFPIKDDVFIKVEHLQPLPESEAIRKSLSFDEVPGPKYLRYMSKFWGFLPAMGTQVTASVIQYLLSGGSQLNSGNNGWFFKKVLEQYGPVARLHGPFGGDVVIVSRPEHAIALFQSEGSYPMRACLDCLEKYRLQYRKYKQAGAFLMYGPEWEKLRESIEGSLQTCTNQQFEGIKKTSDEFLTRILLIRNKQEEVPATFNKEIHKWALECMCCTMLNMRLGFLNPSGLESTSEPARMLDALNGATYAISRCESGIHFWKFFETPAWRSLIKHCDVFSMILNKYIYKVQESLHQKKMDEGQLRSQNASLAEMLLLKDELLPEDILTLLLDMALIGVNAISHSIAFLMYNLSRNPRAQQKLYQEIMQLSNPLNKDQLLEMKYLNSCIKESLRLNPPMPILSRILTKDIVIHNYRIPKGAYMLITTHLASMREEYFEDAHQFKPDRWLEKDLELENAYIPVSMPFGYGQKSCIARGLAELQIAAVLVKLIRQFRIEYHYGEIHSTNRCLPKPDRPLKFRLVERV